MQSWRGWIWADGIFWGLGLQPPDGAKMAPYQGAIVKHGLADLMTHDGTALKRWVDSRLYQKVLSMIREAEVDEAAVGGHAICGETRDHTARYIQGWHNTGQGKPSFFRSARCSSTAARQSFRGT